MQLHIQIRILVVIDGRVELSKKRERFGLGFVLEALEAEFAPYVRFTIDVAKHDGTLIDDALGGRTLRYPHFHFTDSGFDIDQYHQIWFFADQPISADADDGAPSDDDIAIWALSEEEVLIVAQWMERGGGVFAAGDHSILGAALCSGLPRVRTMRKWTHAQGVPSKNNAGRHQTLQPVTGADPESDTLLQPVELVMHPTFGTPPFAQAPAPHPIFTTATLGYIDRFPDHMHEGEVIADREVQLELPTLPDLLPEYPWTGQGIRPNPHVAAFGMTTNPRPLELQPALLPPSTDPGQLHLVYKRFGLVGTYDGNPVGIGRVVVDSTWHHWFSLNLVGIAEALDRTAFLKMQTYYRNVGLWLATPIQRRLMTMLGVLRNLVEAAPEDFSPNDSPWQIGERLYARLRTTTSEAMIDEWLAAILDPAFAAAIQVKSGKALSESDPSWHALPQDVVRRALLGGIGSVLARLARDYRNRRAVGETPMLDMDTIAGCAPEGIKRGHELIQQTIREAAKSFAQMESAIAAGPGDSRPKTKAVRAGTHSSASPVSA